MVVLDMDHFWEKLNEECEKQAKAEVASLPSLSAEEAVAIQTELLERYGDPEFQVKLYNIYANEDPRSKAYNKKLSALFRSARAEVLPKYGITADEEGSTKVAIVLGDFHEHPEVEMLTGCIDSVLYSGEDPMIENSKTLSKKQVLSICRAQVAAFKKPEFQEKIQQKLKTSTSSGMDYNAFRSNGCSELALKEQRPILQEYGLEPNERGVHSLLHQVAQYIMDPEVSACVAAINTLLGMDKSAIESFAERAMEISQADPCPRIAKVEEPPPPEPTPEPVPTVFSEERYEPKMQKVWQPSQRRSASTW